MHNFNELILATHKLVILKNCRIEDICLITKLLFELGVNIIIYSYQKYQQYTPVILYTNYFAVKDVYKQVTKKRQLMM